MTLKYTHAEVREREAAHVGVRGRPNAWWPGGIMTNDCVGFQTVQLGLRTGHEDLAWLNEHRQMISIAAFRAHYRFPEVAPNQLQPGDLVLSNWTGTRVDGELEREHMEWVYSVDHSQAEIVIIGANTGPQAGQALPNGVWRKTRRVDGHIVNGIRLPYAPDHPSRARRYEVATVAAYLNEQDLGQIPKSTAANPGDDHGREGRNYWRRVQTWGRRHGYYGSRFVIDGIPGSQSRIVEAAAYKAATGKQ